MVVSGGAAETGRNRHAATIQKRKRREIITFLSPPLYSHDAAAGFPKYYEARRIVRQIRDLENLFGADAGVNGISGKAVLYSSRLTVQVRNQTRGSSLGNAVDVADTSAKRRVGLLKHKKLEPGTGLWILPCESVHTFFMKFAIDLVYLDKRRKVRKVRHAVPPWRLSACLSAQSVLELPPGTAAESGTKVGDQLAIDEVKGAAG